MDVATQAVPDYALSDMSVLYCDVVKKWLPCPSQEWAVSGWIFGEHGSRGLDWECVSWREERREWG